MALLQQALILHRQGRLEEAASLYRKMLAENPRNADALHLLGVIELQKRSLPAALRFIDRAIEIDPDNAAFLSNRGVALQDLKRYDEALSSYDRALATRPDNAEVLNNRGTVLRELKRFGESVQSYDRALALRPDYAEAHNNRGNALRELNRFDEAVSSYDRALKFQSGYADAWSNRGLALQELERWDEALASFDKAIALRPEDAVAHRNRGVALSLLQRHGDAVASFEKAIALKSDYAQAHNSLGNALAQLGKPDEAVACYQRALALKPDYAEAHINAARVLKDRRRFHDSILHYRAALAMEPRYVEAHLHLGEIFLEQGRREHALKEAEAAARLEELPLFPHFGLGVLFARCDRNHDARRHLLKYLEQDAQDSLGARLILAGLNESPLPQRASDSHLLRLYAERAARWSDAGLYRGHELTATAVKRLAGGRAGFDVLDAGCGTGLVGLKLRDIARRLDGVDLSPAMLDKARQTRVYDGLHEGDLVQFLAAHPAGYDVIASAATLIHFGDLEPVFRAAAKSLRAGGLFAFTLFPNDADERNFAVAPLGGLAEGGCYVHHPEYVARLASDTGYSVVSLEREVHEHDNRGKPVYALIVALRREAES